MNRIENADAQLRAVSNYFYQLAESDERLRYAAVQPAEYVALADSMERLAA